ncbi:MAG: phosphoglucosamine mutase [Actinobacteria bacterium]|nr:phosphoglucosamine mutase [Actinomycetota bacterium]
MLPTPAIAFWSHRQSAPAAVITASHNPWTDNGVKIFAPGGLKLADDVEAAIEARLASAPADAGDPSPPRGMLLIDDVVADYLEHVVEGLPRLGGLHVVLDCANGAMSGIAPRAFERLGARIDVINDTPDGSNINHGCGATAPGALCAAVVERHADLGLAFDGDGDRVIAVDHLGNVVDGDHLLALAAVQLRDQGRLADDTVVVTVMSNLGFHRAMASAGVRVVTTPVGDRSVLEALDAGGLSLGGEQSGHIIYRSLATTGDGLLAGLRLAADVHDRGRPLAELAAAAMTAYPQVLINVRVADAHPRVADELAADVATAEASLAGEGRVLLRASGTEPLIRVMVEAPTSEAAWDAAEGLADVVRRRFG